MAFWNSILFLFPYNPLIRMLILISFSVSYPCYAAIQTPGGFWCVSSDILMVVNWRFVSPMLRENIYNDDDGWRLSARWGREEGRENRFHKYPKYAFSSIRSIFFNPSATRYTARRDSFNVVVLSGWLFGWYPVHQSTLCNEYENSMAHSDWLTDCLSLQAKKPSLYGVHTCFLFHHYAPL